MSDISKGNHLAQAVKIEFGYTAKGTEKIDVIFRIEDGPDVGKEIQHSLWLSEKAMKHTIKALRLMGWGTEDISEVPELCEAGEMNGQVMLVVDDEPYEGKVYRKVKYVNPPSKMTSEARKKIGARLKKVIQDVESGAPPEIPASPGVDSDDIPF